MKKKINVVFMGGFTYPHGMAGTKRIQHAIMGFRQDSNVSSRVIVQRQCSQDNVLFGTHEGTPYETVMGDLVGMKVGISLPLLYLKTTRIIKEAWESKAKNILYHYGPVAPENIIPLYYGRYLGYKIIFDIHEDYGVVKKMSNAVYHRVKFGCIGALCTRMLDLASGLVVISSRLAMKYRLLSRGRKPIHFMAISVDMDRFPVRVSRMNSTISLFYAGSFGLTKEGLLILLDAFDDLAEKRKNIQLVLSGKGRTEEMERLFSRVEKSPYKERIQYKGYLDEDSYYSALNSVDIPCMTRIDSEYNNAGFPFKLGEFLASGKPVIASGVSDIEQFLVNKKNAMVVRPGDCSGIVKAVEYLVDNPVEASVIGESGREVAKSFFDYKQQGKALLSFLENV